MKILIVNYRFHFSGGPERYMFNLIDELDKLGHEVITFSVKNSKNEFSPYETYFARNIGNSNEYLFESFDKNILSLYDFLTREFYSFYIKIKLRKLINDTRPEICYLLPHKGSLSPSIIDELKHNNIPIIHRISDYNIICIQGGFYRDRQFCDDCKFSKLNVIRHKCVKNSIVFSTIKYLSSTLHKSLALYTKIDHFITTNDYALEKFVEFGYNIEKFTTIKTFASNVYKKEHKKCTLPIKFVCIGNIDDSKGTYDLINASIELVKEGYGNYFIINLYGGLREYERIKVEKLIKKHNLNEIVKFNSVISPDKIAEIYKQSDVTIIPARWVENLPNVLIESISNGTPVIVPKFGSFITTVNELVAYFFSHNDYNSLKDVIKNIIDNPNSINEKSDYCYDFSMREFNKKIHTNQLLELFTKYINR